MTVSEVEKMLLDLPEVRSELALAGIDSKAFRA